MRVLWLGWVVVAACVLSSCGREQSYPANDVLIADARFDPGPAVVIDDPGEMHNDIVAAFFRHWPADRSQQSPERMVTALTLAFNEVLPEYTSSARVDELDTRALLQAVTDLWTLAGFDPADPDADPGRIVRALADRGDITAEEAAYAQTLVTRALSGNDVAFLNAAPPPTRTLADFADVMEASGRYWTTGKEPSVATGPVKGFLMKVIDSVVMLSKLGPIARILGSASASVMFEMFWDGVADWWGSIPPYWCPCGT